MKFKGFTLIELMLTVFLGSLLLLGAMEVYLSLHQTYQTQQKLARMQENGRFVVFYLNRSITTSKEKCSGIKGYPNPHLNSYWQSYLSEHAQPNTDAIVVSTCASETAYFIAKSSTSLYEKQTTNERSQELVEGVSNMQIKYGVQNASQKLIYLPAKQVADWQKVVSVDISLLIQDKKWYTYVKLP